MRRPIGALVLSGAVLLCVPGRSIAAQVIEESDYSTDASPTPVQDSAGGQASAPIVPEPAQASEVPAQSSGTPAARLRRQPGTRRVAIQAEFNPMPMVYDRLNYVYGNPAELPPFELGLRFYPAKRIGVDIMMGFSTRSDIDGNSAAGTSEGPGSTYLYPEIGVCADCGRDRECRSASQAGSAY